MLVGGFKKALGGVMSRRLAAGFAESEKDIKIRLKSVSSTKKDHQGHEDGRHRKDETRSRPPRER
jgi:hypothetical protein